MVKIKIGNQVVEIAPFSIKEYITEEQIIQASNDLQKGFVEKQNGFIRRELVKKSQREYMDIVRWETEYDALNAMQNAMKDPTCYSFFLLMENTNHENMVLNVDQLEILKIYE